MLRYVPPASVLIAFLFVPAPPAGGLPKAEAKCFIALNHGGRLISKMVGRDHAACVRAFAKEKTPSATTCATSDPKGLVAKMVSKLDRDHLKHCASGLPPFGPQDTQSVEDAALAAPADLFERAFGSDLDTAIYPMLANGKADLFTSKCQQQIASRLAKCEETLIKEFVQCARAGALETGAAAVADASELEARCLDDPTSGGIPDAKGKIAILCDGKLADGAAKQCFDKIPKGADPAGAFASGECAAAAAVGAQALADCLARSARCEACLQINGMEGLGRDCDDLDDGILNASCLVGACTDLDGDGFAVEGGDCGPVDCNDANPDVSPAAPELCNGIDDNCDGVVDELCPECAPGQYRSCYTGPPGTENVGECLGGAQSCSGGLWGPCLGDITPQTETCNGLDDDCNGVADDVDPDDNPICSDGQIALGSVAGDSGTDGVTDSWGDEEWLVARIEESGDPFNFNYISATVELTSPPGMDFDLFVYCADCGGTLAGSSATSDPTETVDVRRSDTSGIDDSFEIVIEVRYAAGALCDQWDLTVSGNTTVASDTCS